MTYPKCGTTWMRYIVWSIQNRARLPLPTMDELSFKLAPFLERAGTDVADKLPSPRTLHLHTTYQLTPYHKKAKYIYVAREPKDTAVSNYYFARNGVGGPDYREASFDEFFEKYIEGQVIYGEYFDHLVDWWNHRNDENVLFLTYEMMKRNPEEAVLQVAQFISDKDTDYVKILQENDGEILKRVIENTSFKSMKRDIEVVVKTATPSSSGDKAMDNGVSVTDFFRKGVVGDWVNHMSQEQVQRLEKRFKEKVGNSPLLQLWN